MKKIASYLLILAILFSMLTITAAANDEITIYVNEQILQCDVAPYIENGRTMVPMRKIFEALNATVNWDDTTQTITATTDNAKIVLQIDNTEMYNNGITEVLDVAPVIVNGSTFVPVRAVSQSLNASVEWLDKTNTVYINSPNAYNNALCTISSAEEQITMYAPDARTISVLASEAESYKNVGWFYEPVTLMYAADGRTLYVPNSEVDAHKNVGWYLEPVTLMYATDDRTIYVPNSEVNAHKNVGWYSAPPVKLYAPDGRTIFVGQDEVYAYTNVGWYKTYSEAQAANKPVYSSNSSSSDYDNQPNSGGSAVYRTPSGKRYHFDPNCGGKNSYQTTLQSAKSAGLTPCKKCAY